LSAGILIVGGGLASARVVKGYRQAGGADALRILSSDAEYPYFRPPLSKRFMRGEVDADGTLVEERSYYEEHGCAVDLETTVASVGASEVRLASGDVVPFDRLVVATGATPRKLDVPGADLDGVFSLRTLADATAIRSRAADARRAFVVGTNFIGLETAASLTQLGVEVTICDRGDQLFAALEVPAFSAFLADLYREHGVEVLSGDEVAEIRGNGSISSVVTKNGEERDTDLLVAGIGVVPNTGALVDAGLELDDGVLVNERFQSSRDNVFAVGDVARFYDPVYGRRRRIEHASNASYQGAELGKVLAGADGGYDTVSMFFSEVFGAAIRYLGDATGHDGVVQSGDFANGEAIVLQTAGDRIVAALTMGQDDDELERLKDLIRAKALASEF
jgi:NADPH-dependent 2,4-dienoyl-CoA reductase/sulfur reductase-like enzyme